MLLDKNACRVRHVFSGDQMSPHGYDYLTILTTWRHLPVFCLLVCLFAWLVGWLVGGGLGGFRDTFELMGIFSYSPQGKLLF